MLTALGAVNALVVTGPDGSHDLHIGMEAVSVVACVAVVAWRRNLLMGLATAATLTALGHAIGLV